MAHAQLHVLTDATLAPGRSHADLARAAFNGGADVVQLRDKFATPEDLVSVARDLVSIARAAGGLLVVNDYLSVALAADADGLHLGPDDLAPDLARRTWRGLLGGSARTAARAAELTTQGCDYVGVGPVFATSTKPGLPAPLGTERIAEIARTIAVPVIGIGGIGPHNARDVVRAGAAGVAVLSFVAVAKDPEEATIRIRLAIDGA